MGPAAAADEEGATEAKGEGRAGWEQEEQGVLVDAETFERWLDSTEFEVGVRVQKWWARVELAPEGELAPLKTDDDETVADLFGRLVAEGVRADVAQAAGEDGTAGATVHVATSWRGSASIWAGRLCTGAWTSRTWRSWTTSAAS